MRRAACRTSIIHNEWINAFLSVDRQTYIPGDDGGVGIGDVSCDAGAFSGRAAGGEAGGEF